MLVWISLGLFPFLAGLVTGRRWALLLGAGVAGLSIITFGLFGEPDPHGDGVEWPLWSWLVTVFPVFIAFPAALSAAAGIAVRCGVVAGWRRWGTAG